jgi:uncharacterized membrane protein YeiH
MSLYPVFDLSGTFVFALSGAMAGAKHKLDIFGVLVLAFVAGNSGGIIRDVMIGATPPPAVNDWRYLGVSMLAGVITACSYRSVDRLRAPILWLDAAGLALFAVAGAEKSLAFHLGAVASVMLGMLTGIGGGMLRDILVTEIPTVLRADLYALAALAAAAVVVIGLDLQLPPIPVTVAGALLCFGLRFMAIRYGWRLPVVRDTDRPAATPTSSPAEKTAPPPANPSTPPSPKTTPPQNKPPHSLPPPTATSPPPS